MNNPPAGLKIGIFTFSYFGILVVAAVILSIWLSYRRLKDRKLQTEYLPGLAIIILVFSTLGARLWYTAFPPLSAINVGITAEFYRRSLLDFLTLWQGGYALPGAMIGGTIGFLLFAWRKKLSVPQWAAALSVTVPFSTAIILWGNFINQQNYGLPATLPWGIFIEEQYRIAGFETISTYHPLFLYQSLWALLTVVSVILYERKNAIKQLTIPLTGVILSAGFFLLEFLRVEVGLAGYMNRYFWAASFTISLGHMLYLSNKSLTSKL